MKNIHILPTDKPSRLVKFFTNKLHLCKEILPIQDEEQYQNIYITSDEEIKQGDWCIYKTGEIIHYLVKLNTDNLKKIILTTDQDLIKDGVQAIDDEFLEWFVKNPSCEFVNIRPFKKFKGENEVDPIYKIIIPKESKQETLEEAAKSNYEDKTARIPVPTSHWINSEFLQIQNFKEGAKWQQERMYSEAIEFAEWIRIKDFQTASKDNWIGLDMKYYTTEELFKQFKK